VAVRPITTLPDDGAVLRAVAKKVKRIDTSTHALVEDLIDSMYAANGVGLAAPQIGVSLKVVVIGMPGEEPFAMINPEIVKRSGAREAIEGCLSVPGYQGRVIRSLRVTAKAQGLNGKAIRIRAENDLLAQALEHEINHINGIVYIDQVASPEQLWALPLDDDEDESDDDQTDE
jgi:peptide deformylase